MSGNAANGINGRVVNILGQSFGRLTVQRYMGIGKHNQAMWECLCSCGKVIVTAGVYLRYKETKSCGCHKRELWLASPRGRTHGHCPSKNGKPSPTYSSWKSMNDRCYQKHTASYPNYGGKGITVCDRWRYRDGFINFLADVGERPDRSYSLDRIDPNANYEPGNVRWATKMEQAANKRLGRPRVTAILDEMLAASTDLLERGVLLRVRFRLLGV